MGMPVRVHVHRKAYKELTDLRLVQSFQAHNGAVWTMKFSVCGTMLATAGQDGLVKIWKVQHRPEMDVALLHGAAAAAHDDDHLHKIEERVPPTALHVFDATPMRVYRGHKADVLDLSWSRSRFLLSSSMDRTVRLWHSSMDECLRIFSHPDFVTAIDFDPSDDRFFLSGSLDEKLRMWNIPAKTVDDSVDVHEMITAARFMPAGETCAVGTHTGKCRFYSCEGNTFEYVTQLDVGKSSTSVGGRAGLPAAPGAATAPRMSTDTILEQQSNMTNDGTSGTVAGAQGDPSTSKGP